MGMLVKMSEVSVGDRIVYPLPRLSESGDVHRVHHNAEIIAKVGGMLIRLDECNCVQEYGMGHDVCYRVYPHNTFHLA